VDPLTVILIVGLLWLLSSGNAQDTLPLSGGSGSYGDSYGSGGYGGGQTQGGAMDNSDIDTLARTLYGEASGEPLVGKQAVANVVMNRYRSGGYGASVAAVCTAHSAAGTYQFSCWSPRYSRLAVIRKVTSNNTAFQECQRVAQAAVAGTLPDNTGGAENYYAPAAMVPPGRVPDWVAGMVFTAQIGSQRFYRPGGIA
jgi:spore germination cell wall hydrolase CwlJ-like protein